MRQLTQKLHSRRGASILLALLFFLVCGFVGSVVLGSAVANAEKLQGRQADQQTYYAVSSAARLIRTALDGASCQGVEQKTIYQCAAESFPGAHSDLYPAPTLTLPTGDDRLGKLLRAAAESVFKSQLAYTAPPAFTPWQTDFTVTAQDLPMVQVHMAMDESYTAVFTLQTETGGYAMTLTCPATALSTEATRGDSCTHTLTTVDEETGEPSTTAYTFDFTEYTRTTTVTWATGSITKGVSADVM